MKLAWIVTLAAAVALACFPPALLAQGRPKEVECSFLLFSGCRNYVIEVVRIEPDGSERRQRDLDTYLRVDPDTLDRQAYLVLELFEGDRLNDTRSVIWVERSTGSVGGDWPGVLKNDAVRSARLSGIAGDVVELLDSRTSRQGAGVTRLVLLSGKSSCETRVNLDEVVQGGCTVKEGGKVAGKVSRIVIKYRASPAQAGPGMEAFPADTLGPRVPALPDTLDAGALPDTAATEAVPDTVGSRVGPGPQ